jgi:hypothetical protein
MRTVDFSRILIDSIQLCGLDRDTITYATFSQLRDFASNRLKMAWEHDKFPDLMRLQQVTVTHDEPNGIYYFVKPTNFGEIFNVWHQNPNSTSRAKSVAFKLTSTDTDDRVILGALYDGSVFVEYRIIPPELSGSLWNNTTTYYVGSQVYFDSGSNSGTFNPVDGKPYTANFYNCLIGPNNNHLPESNPTIWSKVKIPYVLGQYLSRAVFADYLRSEGQFDSAQVAEAEAMHFLDLEVDKVVRQQGQVQTYNFIQTY